MDQTPPNKPLAAGRGKLKSKPAAKAAEAPTKPSGPTTTRGDLTLEIDSLLAAATSGNARLFERQRAVVQLALDGCGFAPEPPPQKG